MKQHYYKLKDKIMEQMKSSDCPHHKESEKYHKNLLFKFFFPLIGLASLIWMLIRIIPKPSRAEYPCMKVAAPVASGFIVYILGLAAAAFSFQQARQFFKNSKYALAFIFLVVCLTAGVILIINNSDNSYASTTKSPVFVPTDAANSPMGTAKGIHPGRVVWMWDPSVSSWNGTTGNWWDDKYTNPAIVDSMLSKSLHSLT